MISNNADENMSSHYLRLVTLSHVLSDHLHFPVEPNEACMMIYTIDGDHDFFIYFFKNHYAPVSQAN